MSRYNPHFQAELVFNTAEQWKDECLLGGGSLFTDRELWTLKNVEDLLSDFNKYFDAEGQGFLGKLYDQSHASGLTGFPISNSKIRVDGICESLILPP